jgi:hypothetical protein
MIKEDTSKKEILKNRQKEGSIGEQLFKILRNQYLKDQQIFVFVVVDCYSGDGFRVKNCLPYL